MATEEQTKEILLSKGLLNEKEISSHLKEAKKNNLTLEDYLISKKIISENQLYEAAANFYKVPFVNLEDRTIRKDILFLIPEPIAQTHRIIAFDRDEKELKIAALDPQDLEIFEFLRKKTGLDIKIFLTTPEGIRDVLKNYHKGLKAEFKEITIEEEKEIEPDGGEKLKELAQDLPVVRIVDTLLEYAIFENASDIHIEPGEKELNIRYRIDGILKNVMTLPKTVHAGIIARIKILSNLKLDEHRLPQDGRFKITTPEYRVSFRVSVMPTFDGEKIVLRLLSEKSQLLDLEKLGFLPKVLETVKINIEKPHGMILVTGPTGCGKTTTLYAILNVLNKPEVNISTIEDPIEYRLPHINQSQVNPKIGFTFSTGLRALLRQDPDIVMVGEIRDQETADIAVHAALTGHLVLSTLHTNDAATTLPRLADIGTPYFLIASTVNMIIAQRLVRKICSDCIQSYNLSKEDITELEKQIDLKTLLKILEREGIITAGKQSTESLLFYKGKGCKKCNNEGYKGRIGIYEVLEVSEKISNLILRGATADELNKTAKEQGMISMLDDGFIKVLKGITTIEEILRVTRE